MIRSGRSAAVRLRAGVPLLAVAAALACASGAMAQSNNPSAEQLMGPATAARQHILVHITHGPENPTRAALAFLVARTALQQGHGVSLFLAGDAVQLLRDDVINHLVGLGTGTLREHYDAIIAGGGRFYLSGGSSRARGITEADVEGKAVEFSGPDSLIKLALEADRVFTY